MSLLPRFRLAAPFAAALLALAQPLAATAAPVTVTLQDRQWIQHVSGFAGMGVAAAGIPCTLEMDVCNVTGSTGSAALQSGLAPATASTAGSVQAFDADGQFTATFNASWRLDAFHELHQVGADTVLRAGTRHESTMETAASWTAGPPVVTDVFSSLNFQRLYFTLDAATTFSISGSVWGEYNPILLRKDDGQGSYIDIGLGAITSESSAWFDDPANERWDFSGAGSLGPGRYWIENFTLASNDSEPGRAWRFGQSFDLVLHDTVIAGSDPGGDPNPVPEPTALALALGGLLGLRVTQQRRRRS